ncbi:chemotaxis protein CheA [Thioalkalivibrio halophilus]|uniref:Chemotaxis protein CheA n=1 Tax=Thioalkalivibrio halophilus TaxID=252474 RepID=A0A1V3A1X2_9GAMM|nr:chemotaxis protein CheA [Thioalkalivibrio halophilus]OOC11360.1 chemotaxis protein CheA [Thioalkalivibrio halophilus]
MAIDPNDEILQDFLIEAGELLEGLNEQLIDLEQHPDDTDLLNAVFRSFHTIKGGAGFLGLDPLVTVCHNAEDVFNLLRNHERQVDGHLMDTMLRVLDSLNVMFGELRDGQEPTPAPEDLVDTLRRMARNETVPAAGGGDDAAPVAGETPDAAPAGEAAPASADDWPAEALEEAAEPPSAPAPAADDAPGDDEVRVGAGDEITDDEFEALLDSLHGDQPPKPVDPGTAAESAPEVAAADGGDAGGGDDEITDDEFESLLDELQAKGAGPPTTPAEPAEPGPSAAAEPVPEGSASAAGAGGTEHADTAPAAEPAAASPGGTGGKEQKAESSGPAPASGGGRGGASGGGAGGGGQGGGGNQGETSVRVDTERLDEIMNLVGELVLVRNRLSMLRSEHVDDELGKAISSLALVTSDLQASVMKTRMQPVKKVFNRFPRVIRDLSRNLGKEIDLEIFGEETDLDKNLVEALADPMVHLVRNAVDHGIEMPDEREAAGKPRRGTVVLGAAQEGDHIALIIKDDGRGMDPDALRRKAVEKELMEPAMAERMTDREAFNVIFMAGFSTKAEISDVSGRGVGMDVVKTSLNQLNGTVEIESEVGVGTTLRVKLPLTLAILPALMVILGERRFAIPLAAVSEILDLDLTQTHYVDEQEVIVVRNQTLPIHYLARWAKPGVEPEPCENAHVVVVHAADRKVGLVVDGLVGQEEVVIKPLGQNLQGVKGLAGATITGDGGIALILDVSDLVTLLVNQVPGSGRARRAARRAEG